MGADLQRRAMRRGLVLFVCGLWAWGCGVIVPPPLTAPFRPRQDVAIENFKFRVAVMDFTDQTGQAGDLVKTIPDILTTVLFKTGRLDLYEREPLRGLSPRDAGETIQSLMDKRMIDGVVSGTVTRFSRIDKTIVVELRLLSRNKAVMYADQHTLSFQGRRSMEITRDDVVTLGESISKAVPRVPDMKIVSKNADLVTLNGGSNKGLVVGMTGYVQTYLEKVNDPETGEIPKPTPVIVGEVVIDQVGEDTAIGRMIAGEDILANDTLRFK
ncbi:MAG TPA: hypothetical protein VLY20_06240 [Nitrospiria bacterium]|nr:hypothetical protein [Nitrospiria bacterium]